jgi:hypothetical protein
MEESDDPVEEKTKMPLAQTGETNKEIEKAIRFWRHPSMQNVPAEEKIQYLYSRGLNKEDIHQVWERLTEDTKDAAMSGSGGAPHLFNIRNEPPQQQNALVPPPQQHSVPPQYYPQQQQQPYPPENDTAGTYSDIPALLVVGGALGLTAAAALRWLNGGEFLLFPPPTLGEGTNHVQEETTSIVNKEEDMEHQVDHDETRLLPTETDESSKPLESNDDIQKVMEMLEVNFAKQQGLLQQISNRTNKQLTDESMNLLRNIGSTSNNNTTRNLVHELEEIKQQLEALWTRKGNDSVWETQLEECLTLLKECMTKISSDDPLEKSSSASVTPIPVLNGSSSAFIPQDAALRVAPSEGDSKSVLLRQAIRRLAEQNEPASLRAGAQLLYLYVINLSSHPHVPRYQKIFTTNESFQKVQELQGGIDLLLAVGFQQTANCLEWHGGSDVTYLKEAAAALSILKSCSDESNATQLTSKALSVLRPSTPPLGLSMSDLQTPVFIASPPTTKKHPLLDESGDDSILDMSNASEQFKSRLESLAQPVIHDVHMFGIENDAENSIPKTSLSMRGSGKVKDEEERGEGEEFDFASDQEWTNEEEIENNESGDPAELGK